MRILSTVFAAANLTAASMVALAPPADASAGGTSGILTYGEDLQPDTGSGAIGLDPASSSDNPLERPFMQLIYDNLVREGPGGTALPGLATSWSFPSAEAITLHLRVGVRFQDGTPFNAEAVRYGLRRNMSSASATFNPAFHNLRSVIINGPYAVTLELSQPVIGAFFPLLWGPETYIVSPAAAVSEGSSFGEHPVGAGPYRVTGFTPSVDIMLRKSSGYWEKSGWRLHGVNFVNVGQGQPQVTSYLAGQIDMFQPNTTDERNAVSGTPHTSVAHGPALGNYYLGLCTKGTSPLDQLDVREAIAHALDRRLITNIAAGGVAEASDQPWPSSSVFYDHGLAGSSTYDPKLARALLRKAGYPHGFALKVETIDFSELTTIGLVIQQELRAVGIRISLRPSGNFVQDQLIDKQAPADISADIEPGAGLVTFMDPTSIADFCKFDDPGVTAALSVIRSSAPASGESSGNGLAAAWHTVDHALLTQVPGVIVFVNGVMLAYNNEAVGGVEQLYDQSAGPNFKTIYLK